MCLGKYVPELGPAMARFWIPRKGITRAMIEESCAKNGIIWATSFGKDYSLINRWPKPSDEGVWLRLSIGLHSSEEEVIASCKGIICDLSDEGDM